MNRTVLGLLIASSLLAAGCGSKTTVAGSVTYNGAPIENGYLTFSPRGGGTSFAAPIKDGRYSVAEAKPGDYVAVIIGTRAIDHYASSAEAYAKAGKHGGHISEAADYIDVDAAGNSQECKISSGEQSMDFAVTGKPAPK